MVTPRLGLLAAAHCLAIGMMGWGCRHMPESESHLCQVVVGNRSDHVLSSVVVDPRGVAIDFGFLGKGSPSSLAGAGYQRIRFVDDMAIQWQEDDAPREAVVDTKPYERKRDQIKSVAFLYAGNGRWQVIARDDITRDANEVRP